MSVYFKCSGKKIKLTPQSSQSGVQPGFQKDVRWQFTRRPGGWLIAEAFQEIQGMRVRQLRKRILVSEKGSQMGAFLGKTTVWGEWLAENSRRNASGKGVSSNEFVNEFVAQFPGKIRKVLAHANEEVKEGDVLILVEAMKMEFAIRAPSSGKVIRMRVVEGEQIPAGTLFLDWENSQNGS